MSRTLLLVLLFTPTWFAQALGAQCGSIWRSGGPQAELSGTGVSMTTWDPDGAGPLPQQLVVGGDRLLGGSDASRMVMTWDGNHWQALGPAPAASGLYQLINWNGFLVAAGDLPGVGNIVGWNGAAWLPLGPGVPFAVNALTVWNGNLVAIGPMSNGSSLFTGVRSWDGVTWTSLPTPPLLNFPRDATVYQGQLCIAGLDTIQQRGILARWNGSAWAPAITGNNQSDFVCMTVRQSQAFGGAATLYLGGRFSSIGGTAASNVAATTGGATFAWSPVGTGITGLCFDLIARNGTSNNFTLVAATNSPTGPVMRYSSSLTGGSWSSMGTSFVTEVTFSNGIYYALSGSETEATCLSWDGTAWVPVRGPGFHGEVRTLTARGARMIVGGVFSTINGMTTNHIAEWDGAAFVPLGVGVNGTSVDALLTLDNGEVVAGGAFTTAGGVAANNLARWNGSGWSAFGTGLNQPVLAICKMPNGDLVVGGSFTTAGGVACSRIARWNGNSWSPLGSGMNGDVRALVGRGDGVLFAAGSFTLAGGLSCNRIAQWNGSGWLPLGAGCNNTVHGLATRPNGDVIAIGDFTDVGSRIARWFGTGWAPMGAPGGDATAARTVWALPNGDVIAGRGFHQSTTLWDSGISRWDANTSTWFGIGLGLTPFQQTGVRVRAFAQRANGDLIVGGSFSTAGGLVSRDLAVLSSSCPATALPYGTGCNSAIGPIVITADTLPWLGASFRTTTTGLVANTLCFRLIGFTQSAIPLNSLHPRGQPGCLLLASPDSTMVVPQAGGLARSELALPTAPSLLGVTFFQQTIPVEFDLAGAIVAVRASNALSLVIGTF